MNKLLLVIIVIEVIYGGACALFGAYFTAQKMQRQGVCSYCGQVGSAICIACAR